MLPSSAVHKHRRNSAAAAYLCSNRAATRVNLLK